MANKNNTSDSLVSDIDDEPTAELEALSDTCVADFATATVRESDDYTQTFNEFDEIDEIPVARLRSHLRTRNESINKLQYDIEQLRARWTGLEKEIRAREQLTDRLNAELRSLRQQVDDREKQDDEHDKLVAALRDQLAERNTQLAGSAAELTTANENAAAHAARVSVLEMQQASNAATTEALEEDVRKLRSERDKQAKDAALKAEQMQEQLQESQTALDDLQQHIQSREAEWREQQDLLAARDALLAERNQEIELLGARLAAAEASFSAMTEEAVAELTINVQDAHRDAVIGDLKAQIERTESYADSVRRKLQDALQDSDHRNESHRKAQEARDHALEQMRELRAQLEEEQSAKAEIAVRSDETQRGYDERVQLLQDELDAVRQASAETAADNEQLTAELLASNASGQSWHDRLNEAEERFDRIDAETQRTIAALKQRADELQRKIDSKDNAIAALLNELAKKSSAMSSLDEIGHAVHDLDDRMLASIDDRDSGERDRSTRLLIGTIDGQKLRFPLFKDRLTIGRSADNDIQLKTACISRRHAVIVSEIGGCRISDQNSKNGVFVNGRRVTETSLSSGDKLVIGTATLVFEERARR